MLTRACPHTTTCVSVQSNNRSGPAGGSCSSPSLPSSSVRAQLECLRPASHEARSIASRETDRDRPDHTRIHIRPRLSSSVTVTARLDSTRRAQHRLCCASDDQIRRLAPGRRQRRRSCETSARESARRAKPSTSERASGPTTAVAASSSSYVLARRLLHSTAPLHTHTDGASETETVSRSPRLLMSKHDVLALHTRSLASSSSHSHAHTRTGRTD